jgi:superfamily II DNA or RNA helicase
MSTLFRQSSLVLRQQKDGQPGFRVCQLGAIWAAKAHFTASNERALISLPTGAGKTAVMMALAFELGARGVFVLTPSVFSRGQTADEFRSLEQLSTRIGALRKTPRRAVNVIEIENELRDDNDWSKLVRFDVAVSTPNAIRSNPPKDFFGSNGDEQAKFDLVFVDEAHHSAATTWNTFLEQTGGARTLLFTATPFRRDRKRIRAKPIYVYPIFKAIKDGIYRKVEYVGVETTDPSRRDAELAETCRKHFLEERKNAPQTAVIIKAAGIEHAKELAQVYKQAGFQKLGVIHSEEDFKHNHEVLRKVKNNQGDATDPDQLNGFICVDIGSEGIDVPNLRIAVFHATPQTLPYTIQVIGRVTRAEPNQKGNALLIADRESARGAPEVQVLYESDEGWAELLPGLFDDYIKTKGKFLPTPGNALAGAAALPADDLKPYQTVRVYQKRPPSELPLELKGDAADDSEMFAATFDNAAIKDRDVQVEVFDKKDNRVVIITRTWEVPRWTNHRAFESERFDLHIYCYVEATDVSGKPHSSTSYVFEFTTFEKIAGWIRKGFWDENAFQRANYGAIGSGLSDAVDGNYLMVGMNKETGDDATPQYKTLMGELIQNAVKFTDGRSFSAGHAVITTDEFTRGIATRTSRVWSNKRDSLENFEAWCAEVAEAMAKGKALPKIENKLIKTEPASEYPEDTEVIDINFDNSWWRAQKVNMLLQGEEIEDAVCRFKDWDINRADNMLTSTLVIADRDGTTVEEIEVEHHFESPWWRVQSRIEVRVDIDHGESFLKDQRLLQEYFQEWPPLILLSSGQTIRNDLMFTPRIQTQRLDSAAIEKKDWRDTDITKEAKPATPPLLYNVQERTEQIIRDEYDLGPEDFLICDDRANEVADYILIQGGLRRKITFFHCKYAQSSGKSKSKDSTAGSIEKDHDELSGGLSKKDLTELTEQAVRTGNWIRAPNLLERLLDRMTKGAKLSTVKHGELDDLKKLSIRPHEWAYAVTLVQPGLSRRQLIKGIEPSQAEQLLIVISDRIVTDYGAGFKVWTRA